MPHQYLVTVVSTSKEIQLASGPPGHSIESILKRLPTLSASNRFSIEPRLVPPAEDVRAVEFDLSARGAGPGLPWRELTRDPIKVSYQLG